MRNEGCRSSQTACSNNSSIWICLCGGHRWTHHHYSTSSDIWASLSKNDPDAVLKPNSTSKKLRRQDHDRLKEKSTQLETSDSTTFISGIPYSTVWPAHRPAWQARQRCLEWWTRVTWKECRLWAWASTATTWERCSFPRHGCRPPPPPTSAPGSSSLPSPSSGEDWSSHSRTSTGTSSVSTKGQSSWSTVGSSRRRRHKRLGRGGCRLIYRGRRWQRWIRELRIYCRSYVVEGLSPCWYW